MYEIYYKRALQARENFYVFSNPDALVPLTSDNGVNMLRILFLSIPSANILILFLILLLETFGSHGGVTD